MQHPRFPYFPYPGLVYFLPVTLPLGFLPQHPTQLCDQLYQMILIGGMTVHLHLCFAYAFPTKPIDDKREKHNFLYYK